MKNRLKNSFITTGYISPEYFCNRHSETSRLLFYLNWLIIPVLNEVNIEITTFVSNELYYDFL